jgi:hypothetical protein
MREVFCCTCGYERKNGLDALRHVAVWHPKKGWKYEDLVRLFLYTLSGANPFDAYLDQVKSQIGGQV